MATTDEYPWQEPASPITRGAFIVIEGLDRAGKTTQVKTLCDTLYAWGRNVKTLRFPDRTSPIGKMIDSYLQSKTEMDDHAIHLLFSANRWEKAKHIRDSIAQGYTIVCDRYYYSGMVYSAAKQNPSLGLEWARRCDEGLPQPDVVIFLDLDTEQAEKRGGYGEEKYEKKEMQRIVRKIFLKLQQLESNMEVINAAESVDEVAQKIWQVPRLEQILGIIASGFAIPFQVVEPWMDEDVRWIRGSSTSDVNGNPTADDIHMRIGTMSM